MAMVSTNLFRLRIVSYNVLSSHLAKESQYPTLKPEHLRAENRLPVVLKKIEKEIDKHPDILVCLQEVSYDWAGALHTFFANKGFHLVTGLYGKPFNGYMGIAVAFPTNRFQVLDVDISRLAEKREEGWPEHDEPSVIAKVWSTIQSAVEKPLRKLGFETTEVIDHWNMAKGRFNVMLTTTLRHVETDTSFTVGNYHMPCAYYAPMVMTIHSELAARHVERIAQEQGDLPYVLAGDFNIKPSESCYKLLTTGEIDKNDPFYPIPKGATEWTSAIKPMRSAYAASDHGEPDFTNYSRVKEEEPFIDTLDYIFLSDGWKVDSVLPIKNRNDVNGPLPNLDVDEPSDHVLIAASLSI